MGGAPLASASAEELEWLHEDERTFAAPRKLRQRQEMHYAYTSTFSNNGQTFSGLSANNAFYNVTTAVVMLFGRFGLAIPAPVLAQRVALQPTRQPTRGTLPTDTMLFGVIVIGTAVIVVALTYLPTVALGPLIEQLKLLGH